MTHNDRNPPETDPLTKALQAMPKVGYEPVDSSTQRTLSPTGVNVTNDDLLRLPEGFNLFASPEQTNDGRQAPSISANWTGVASPNPELSGNYKIRADILQACEKRDFHILTEDDIGFIFVPQKEDRASVATDLKLIFSDKHTPTLISGTYRTMAVAVSTDKPAYFMHDFVNENDETCCRMIINNLAIPIKGSSASLMEEIRKKYAEYGYLNFWISVNSAHPGKDIKSLSIPTQIYRESVQNRHEKLAETGNFCKITGLPQPDFESARLKDMELNQCTIKSSSIIGFREGADTIAYGENKQTTVIETTIGHYVVLGHHSFNKNRFDAIKQENPQQDIKFSLAIVSQTPHTDIEIEKDQKQKSALAEFDSDYKILSGYYRPYIRNPMSTGPWEIGHQGP